VIVTARDAPGSWYTPGRTTIVVPGLAASAAAWIDSPGWTVTVFAPADVPAIARSIAAAGKTGARARTLKGYQPHARRQEASSPARSGARRRPTRRGAMPGLVARHASRTMSS